MGTRGSVDLREQEAANAASLLGLSVRKNLGLADGWFENDRETQTKVIEAIREYQPEIVLANAPYDRHPDHGRAAKLVEEAFFKSGLQKVETKDEQGEKQSAWRPKKLYHYIQSVSIEPDFIVDISDAHDQKMAAIRAYKSQFYDPESKEPNTYISDPKFMTMLESRAREYGHRIQVAYGEGFKHSQFLGVKDLFDLV
jgi:bacillithiol biosynthesis deacetylase BshB1